MLFQLQQTVKLGLLAHAYLFLGEKNKTRENALDFAAAVNCLFPLNGQACGECLSCKKVKHGNHPDVLVIEPKGASLKIDQVRELQKKVGYKHFEGHYKVLILSGVDVMTAEAANSMLKMLEEPPADTIFILMAENGDNILSTVHSRCQVIKFGGETTPGAREIHEDQRKLFQQVLDAFQNISSLDDDQLLRLSELCEKNKDIVKLLLDFLLVWFRDVAVAKLTGETAQVRNGHMWDSLLNSPLRPEDALLAAQEVERSQRLLGQNANVRLVLDVLFLRLSRLAG